jgi:hypothetical protein
MEALTSKTTTLTARCAFAIEKIPGKAIDVSKLKQLDSSIRKPPTSHEDNTVAVSTLSS